MEVFVRLAKTKFFSSKTCETIPEAVEKLYEDHMLKFFE